MKEYVIYTDGSFVRNKREVGKDKGQNNKISAAGCGFYNLMTGDKVNFKLDKKYNGELTNNVAELMAILSVFLFYLKESTTLNITIKSDSMYCINSLSKWYKTWEKNDWKLKGNKEVANKRLIQLIILFMKKYHSVKFLHVRSHQKKPSQSKKQELIDWEGNYIADELAVEGMKKGIVLDIYTN